MVDSNQDNLALLKFKKEIFKMTNAELLKHAASHWSEVSKNGTNKVLRWWQYPRIWSHINNILDASDTKADPHGGFHRLLKKYSNDGSFERAISVGCGTGLKELGLLKSGLVKHFDLYEISEHRIEHGRAHASELGVSDRVRFIHGNALEISRENMFDLVYWNNSLHHMLDANRAILWSKQMLSTNGVFAMDDFVGPSRFQWSNINLEFASRFRASLPKEMLTDPGDSRKTLKTAVFRPSIEEMIRTDPSEAADSGNILNSIKINFPKAHIFPTGGSIYHIGMNDIIYNVATESQNSYINLGLIIDRLLMNQGDFQYAVCVTRIE